MAKRPTFNLVTFEQHICVGSIFVPLFFAGLAALLFNPFFSGKFAIGGTDVLYNHFPNILFGYREFKEFGQFSMWNRYIFNGADFSVSMHAHYLNPLYWPLLVFPEKYIFHVLTAGFMAMNASTGLLWSRIAVRLGVSGLGSLIVGVVAQAGMFSWFAMTTMASVPMALFSTAAIYLILTRELRGNLTNYLLLSGSLGLIFVTPHPAYILGFFLPVAVVFLVRMYSNPDRHPWKGFPIIFVAASATAIVLAGYRLVPVSSALMNDGNALANVWEQALPYTVGTYAYFGLTAFNPYALGLHISTASNISNLLGFNAHNQFHNALYFGITPLIIVYVALRHGSLKIMLLATAYACLQLTSIFAFQPLTDIVLSIFYPVVHGAIFRIATYFSFLFLLIQSTKALLVIDGVMLPRLIKECVVIAGFVLCAGLALDSRLVHEVHELVDAVGGVKVATNIFRLAILSVLAVVVTICCFPIARYSSLRFTVWVVTLAAMLVVGSIGAYLATKGLPGTEVVMTLIRNGLAVILACFAILFSIGRAATVRRNIAVAIWCAIPAGLVLMPVSWMQGGGGVGDNLWLATAVGWGVFLAIFSMSVFLLARFSVGSLGVSSMMGFMLILTLTDLIPAFSTYSYVNVPETPFVRHIEDIYPTNTLPIRMNLASSDLRDESRRQNLLVNPEFRRVSGMPVSWALGGKEVKTCSSAIEWGEKAQRDAICVTYPADDRGGNLYQDISLPEGVTQVSMGAWVRTRHPMSVDMFVTNFVSPAAMIKVDEKWRWVSKTFSSPKPTGTARPHINLAKAGTVEIFAPRLVSGSVVRPTAFPIGDYAFVELSNAAPMELDLASYRVNKVHLINGYFANEHMTNYAILARTPTYAGVDSDLDRDFVVFLSNFRSGDSSWFHRAGFLATFESDRFLDLSGVAYDLDAQGNVIFRSDAIPRFAAFGGYDVMESRKATLSQLKSPDFDPTRKILLETQPVVFEKPAHADRFKRLTYATPAADTLSVDVDNDTPRLILFNDRFSLDWRAYWNGEPLEIVRANGIFMAVTVPQGSGRLKFVFHPELFFNLAKISAATATLLLLLGFILLLRACEFRIHPPA